MSFTYGKNLKIQVFGQSHAAAIGVVMDGLPAGESVDLAAVAAFMARRAPGKNALSTARKEAAAPEVLSGLVDGHTVGAPLAALIRNTDTRSAEYANLAGGAQASAPAQAPAPEAAPALRIPRPGHSDNPAFVRYGGANDFRGGGAFSGRMTAPLCFAGGVAQQLLEKRGIRVYAHIASVGGVCDAVPDACSPDEAALATVKTKAFPVLDDAAGVSMQTVIAAARQSGDSVGGSIRCIVTGLPAGRGAHMFDGGEIRIAAAAFGIPGGKGIEFGSGFAGCEGFGSRQNDPYTMENGAVRTTKNDAAAGWAAAPPVCRWCSGWRSSPPPPSGSRSKAWISPPARPLNWLSGGGTIPASSTGPSPWRRPSPPLPYWICCWIPLRCGKAGISVIVIFFI